MTTMAIELESPSVAIGGDDTCLSSNEDDKEDESTLDKTSKFSVGDHIYKRVSFAKIPKLVQTHGVVLSVDEDSLTIVDFDAMIRETGSVHKILRIDSKGKAREGHKSWKRVTYKASWMRRQSSSSGTCTSVQSDPSEVVLRRVQFLQTHPEHLPTKYHALKANSECVGVWCKTGTWATLQTSSLLHYMAAGQVRSASTFAIMASSRQVTVPVEGFWGMLGYTTKIPLLSSQPLLLPAIAGYGFCTTAGPVWILRRSQKFWRTTTNVLNEEFCDFDMDQLEIECLDDWNQLWKKQKVDFLFEEDCPSRCVCDRCILSKTSPFVIEQAPLN